MFHLALATLTILAPKAPNTGQTHWLDLDADGRADLYVTAPGQDDKALLQQPDGSFLDGTDVLGLTGHRSIQVLPRPASGPSSAPGADPVELLLIDSTGTPRLFRRDPENSFFDASVAAGIDPANSVREAAWVDYDGDGASDLWTVGRLGRLRLLRSGSAGVFEAIELGATLGSTAPITGVNRSPEHPWGPAGETLHGQGGSMAMGGGMGLPGDPNSTPGAGNGVPNLGDGAPNGSAPTFVADQLVDQAGGAPLEGSRTPTIGSLFPLTLDFFDSSHIKNDSLVQADLAPNSVGVSELAANSIQSVDIIDGQIFNVDVSIGAAIAGTKIDADFGNQLVETARGVQITESSMGNGQSLVSAQGQPSSTGSVQGHVGVVGSDNFGGFNAADWFGFEIGLVGLTTDTGTSDNFGVLGHSDGTAVRGEHAGNPTNDYGELGLLGVGLEARGTLLAARLIGDMQVTGDTTVISDSDFSGTGGGSLILRNTANTRSLNFDNNEIGTTGGPLNLNADNLENTRLNNFLHVKKDAKVGIGTSLPTETLHVNGNIRCISLIQTSDARLKREIETIDGAMDLVRALRGVSYSWDLEQLPEAGEGRQSGFLAQELREVLPDAVTENSDGTLAVSYSQVVPVLVQALQEQEAAFADRIATLEARLERLSAEGAEAADRGN